MPVPKFVPKPGQIDYTHIKRAPVINCVVQYKDKILIVKRSAELHFHPNCWNGISGFLDDEKSIEEKAKEELREELGIAEDRIAAIREAKVFEQEDSEYNKTWIVHPVLVTVKTRELKLDWEAEAYEWVSIAEARKFELLPGFDQVLDAVLNLQ